MASVTESIELTADPARVWAVLADPARFPEWIDSHESFLGDPPTAFTPGAEFGQRLRVMGMPAEVSWTVATVTPEAEIGLTGDGPMGIGLAADYRITPTPAGSQVSVSFDFSGAAVMMVGSQLVRETGTSLASSLQRLKQLVEA